MPRTAIENQKIKKAKETAILKAALDLFVVKGFNLTTTDDICNKLNISHGLFYHYFKDKNEVLKALFERSANLELIPLLAEKTNGYESIKVLANHWAKIIKESLAETKYLLLFVFQDFNTELQQISKKGKVEQLIQKQILYGQDHGTINSSNFIDLTKCLMSMYESFAREKITKTSGEIYLPDVDVLLNLFDKKEVFLL